MGQLEKSYSHKVALRVLLISCCINTLCNFFTILFEKILCQLQNIMFTITRQTTSSAHVVLCNIPKDVHVPSLRKQLTFYDATTGLPAKWHLRNDCGNSILWWQVTTQIWEGHFINIEYLQSFLRCYFAGKPVVASQNGGCFLSLTCACCHFLQMPSQNPIHCVLQPCISI